MQNRNRILTLPHFAAAASQDERSHDFSVFARMITYVRGLRGAREGGTRVWRIKLVVRLIAHTCPVGRGTESPNQSDVSIFSLGAVTEGTMV